MPDISLLDAARAVLSDLDWYVSRQGPGPDRRLADLRRAIDDQAVRVAPPVRFPIGTVYTTRSKHPLDCTVTDVLDTYDSSGAFVRRRYVSTHQFCGQMVVDADVVETTIAMGSPRVPTRVQGVAA